MQFIDRLLLVFFAVLTATGNCFMLLTGSHTRTKRHIATERLRQDFCMKQKQQSSGVERNRDTIKNSLQTLYKFSRPHTIKGTILASSLGVTRAIMENPNSFKLSLVPRAVYGLLALLCGNAYIVGINQIYDVQIDEINKPFLPIAAKILTKKAAWFIVLASLSTGTWIVKTQFSPVIWRMYLVGTTLGTIYSVPPMQLKRFPWCAGGIIATVRGFLLNFGVYYAVREALQVPFRSNPVVVFLSSFMTVFAAVIAVTKDLSDVEGDSKFRINTFATQFGPQRTAAVATSVLSTAYIVAMLLPAFLPKSFKWAPMTLGHGALLAYFLRSYSNLDGDSSSSIKTFYKAIWNLFYLELQYGAAAAVSADVPPYELNVVPANLPAELTKLPDGENTKHIPRKIWMAVKDINDELPGHIKAFFQRNPNWDATVCDNDCKDKFMNTTFAGTSVAWAYHLVRAPPYFASKADIWRYAVMYTYGGMYLDDDSDIRTPLDEVVTAEDRLILSEEGPSSMGDCYVPTFHLSETHTYFTYGHNVTVAKHYTGVDKEGQHQFFHGNTIINWAMFAAPRHPVYKRALQNVVEIVKSMYLRQSVVHITRWDVKFKTFFCTTVFVLTYTVRELELENALPAELLPRISINNFREYGGNVKAMSTQMDPNHYRKQLKHHAPSFLTESVPLNLAQYVQFLEGKSVMGDAGREILLIQNGTKRHFPDYDTFLKMEFTDKHTRHVSDYILKQIPPGPMIDKNEKIVSAYSKTHVHSVLTQQRNNPAHSGSKRHQLQIDRKVKAAFSGAEHQQVVSESNALVVDYLRNVSEAVNTREMGCWGDDYGGTRDDYLKGQWEDLLKGVPAMIYPLCTGMFQLGNTLGYYLNDIACADLSGAHFLAVHKTFALTQPELLVTHIPGTALPFPPGTVATPATTKAMAQDVRYTFFNHLPDLIPHSRPLEPAQVKAHMKAECHCLQFCWENNQAPWLKRVALIGRTLRPAIDAYVAASKAESTGTVLNPQTDQSTLPMGSFLPLLPNVTIQYRCGDNIGFGKSKYGLLPFSAYKSHRVPRDVAKYIYVIADSPQRSAAHVYSGRCETILQRLFTYLVKEHPQAVVVLKRGGDLFLDYARIAYSNVAVCSASTFCLWPALSNQHGQVHFPLTPLVARADTNLTAPNLAPNFHWISDVQMIKQFKHYRPWDRVIDDLETW